MKKENNTYKIQVENVTKTYKMYNSPIDRMKEALSLSGKERHTVFYAIKDLSFSIKKGEILGIVGRNGAGKSTLLKLITGILEPSEGKVSVKGKISSLLELGTGFNMDYTGIENIYFYGTLMGMSKSQMDEKLEDIIAFAEIGDYIYQVVKSYSSGMFARLAFSCAINVEPDILIVDEILSVGDMRFQAKCFNKFKEFRDKGVTILYVGHDVGMMRQFCDEVMWIDKGKLVDKGDPTYICAQYTEYMYLDDVDDFTEYKKFEEKKKEEKNFEEKESKIEKIFQNEVERELFPDSIAHWGSAVGNIKNVEITNSNSEIITYFEPGELINVEITYSDCDTFEYEYLSVAISIKNREGIDLIVKTTFDEDVVLYNKNKEENKVCFSFRTNLANGEYYLVVAIENRRNASISYYEYIEGAKFFKIYTDKRIFGIVNVEAEIKIS
ncbi:ABC transporter ATP-binding protein [bacterium]|nr:ABC transporter ATP-binding protein [bacterium]